ncbi:MAG: hypothetical protein ACREFI_08265, partial [Stellaceae bacterium]
MTIVTDRLGNWLRRQGTLSELREHFGSMRDFYWRLRGQPLLRFRARSGLGGLEDRAMREQKRTMRA